MSGYTYRLKPQQGFFSDNWATGKNLRNMAVEVLDESQTTLVVCRQGRDGTRELGTCAIQAKPSSRNRTPAWVSSINLDSFVLLG